METTNIIHSAIYSRVADYLSVLTDSSVTTRDFCAASHKLFFLVLQKSYEMHNSFSGQVEWLFEVLSLKKSH